MRMSKLPNRPTAGDDLADDTPRPLRIIKRGPHVPFDFSLANSSPRSTETVPHEGVVLSTQASSMLHGHTGSDAMANSSSRLPPVAWPAGSGEWLDVPKQRRTKARPAPESALGRLEGGSSMGRGTGTGTTGTTSTFVSHASTTPEHPHPHTHPHPSPSPNPDPGRRLHNLHNTHTRCTVRASTTGTVQVITSSPSSSTAHTPLASSSPPVVSNLRPRAFTATTSLGYPQHNPPRLPSEQRHRAQPSLRSRLLSRVMNGVAGKARISNATAERKATTRHFHSNSETEAEPCKGSQPPGSRSRTSSSVGTAAAFDGDLDSALAAFPTPPKSAVTSPTTLSSFESSRRASLINRTLAEPRNVALASAQLNVLPEIDRLGTDSGQSVLVAVEIVGGVAPIEDIPSPVSSILKPLDVAIVIDNSCVVRCQAYIYLANKFSDYSHRPGR